MIMIKVMHTFISEFINHNLALFLFSMPARDLYENRIIFHTEHCSQSVFSLKQNNNLLSTCNYYSFYCSCVTTGRQKTHTCAHDNRNTATAEGSLLYFHILNKTKKNSRYKEVAARARAHTHLLTLLSTTSNKSLMAVSRIRYVNLTSGVTKGIKNLLTNYIVATLPTATDWNSVLPLVVQNKNVEKVESSSAVSFPYSLSLPLSVHLYLCQQFFSYLVTCAYMTH